MEIYVLAAAILLAALVLVRGLSYPHSEGFQGPEGLSARLDSQARALDRLATQAEERRRLEEEATEAVREVQRLLAGSFSKGRAGENLLSSALQALPPSMVVRGFRIGGKSCEFALRMADGQLLPVDSKWSGLELAQQLEQVDDPGEYARLRREAERAVAGRVKEVAQYLDPALTLPMAVAAVPDAVFHALERAHAQAHAQGVVIVSYSQAVPYLLSVWHLHRAYAREVEDADLLLYLQEISRSLKSLDEEVEGRLSRSLTMADNAVSSMRGLLSSARAALRALERLEDTSPDSAVTTSPGEEEEPRMRVL